MTVSVFSASAHVIVGSFLGVQYPGLLLTLLIYLPFFLLFSRSTASFITTNKRVCRPAILLFADRRLLTPVYKQAETILGIAKIVSWKILWYIYIIWNIVCNGMCASQRFSYSYILFSIEFLNNIMYVSVFFKKNTQDYINFGICMQGNLLRHNCFLPMCYWLCVENLSEEVCVNINEFKCVAFKKLRLS